MAKKAAPTLPIRSMTGFAQVKGEAGEQLAFTLSLKSVNHRFLDLQLRLPQDSETLEMKLRREIKEKIARGHVELTLVIDRTNNAAYKVNRQVVGGFIQTFREAAKEFGVSAEPDLNAVLKMPGALSAAETFDGGDVEAAVLKKLDEAIARLNQMREEEGRSTARELRERLNHLRAHTAEVEKLRTLVGRAYMEKVESRMKELIGAQADPDRILQEAAILAERSDIQEELVRMHNHINHFQGLIEAGGEVGKKLDFLLQEMNREANTLLSKTTGVAGEALRITELGLAMKSEIEKTREQVQNLE